MPLCGPQSRCTLYRTQEAVEIFTEAIGVVLPRVATIGLSLLMVSGKTMTMRMVGQDSHDATLGDAAMPALADHAAQLFAQRFKPCDLGVDVGQDIARDMIDPLARLIRLIDEPEQLPNCVERKAEFACMADEGKAIGVRFRVSPLPTLRAGGCRHQALHFVESNRLDFRCSAFREHTDAEVFRHFLPLEALATIACRLRAVVGFSVGRTKRARVIMSVRHQAELSTLRMRVEGMDCAACALKIEKALNRMPGASEITVNFGTGALALKLDENRTSRIAIEKKIKALGYTPAVSSEAPHSRGMHDDHDDDEPVGRDWWRTRKGQLVLGIGALVAVAFVVSVLAPVTSFWAYTVAAVVGVAPFARRAATGALSGSPFSIETLMSVAIVGAIAIGAAEESAAVVFLFAVGELLENVAAGRARAGITALLNVVPRVVFVEENGKVREVPADQLAVGNIVVVRPGDRVPSDGQVIDGRSEIDEAPVTGESVPVVKSIGDSVFAGTINASASLRVQITRTAADNTIARIIHLVEQAQGSKAPTARFIDRFAASYTPIAMVGSALVVIVPPLLFGAEWSTWIYRGLATLLIACPCALVISTPAAIASGLAAGAKRGLLIKGGAALEILGRVKTIAFDKTGTLTAGTPRVTDVISFGQLQGETEDTVLANAAAVEQGSSHPLGRAIIAAAQARNLAIPQIFGGSSAVPGKAVTARLKQGFVSVGSPRYAAEAGSLSKEQETQVQAVEGAGKTVVVVLFAKRAAGLIALRDEPREDAREAIRQLKQLGIAPLMLTGDNKRTGDAIGSSLGLDVKAELLPDAKLAMIEELKRSGPVAMIGDGINDAPALAAASVGVAMDGGTDVALETADAALLKSRVQGVVEMILLSRATLANIWQNITIALGLKAVFLATTLTGTTPLWMAILADTGATVLVTANALRLLRVRIGSAERSR